MEKVVAIDFLLKGATSQYFKTLLSNFFDGLNCG